MQTPNKQRSLLFTVGFIVLLLLLTACSGNTSASNQGTLNAPTLTPTPDQPKTAEQYVQALKAHGFPIGETFTYDENTDLNHLLGRPNQYIGKAEFKDTRLPGSSNTGANIEVKDGGSIEVFANSADAANRYKYIHTISSSISIAAEYEYLKGVVILRLSSVLTPTQAKQYDSAINADGTVNSATVQIPQATPTPAQHFKPGQNVDVGQVWQVTIASAKTSHGQDYNMPQAGNIYLLVNVVMKNTSGQEQDASITQWTLRDADGQEYTRAYVSFAPSPPSGKVETGSQIKGALSYEVSSATHKFTLAFEANIVASGQSIWDLSI